MEEIIEGKARILACTGKVSKEMEVFYNPVMKFNRDIAILLLNSIKRKELRLADPLAGSGIRAIRFMLELKKSIIRSLHVNDFSSNAVKSIKKNLRLNKIKKIQVSQEDANLFLMKSTGFDYIDIDPFGTPNPYLDSAVKRISREGILAVTATDTAPLSGTYPDACLRKYWAVPLRNELMHEIGVRILIRKVQLIGAQYDKALLPIFSYSKDHYMRIFFKCSKGKQDVDEVMKQHGHFEGAGPLWLGRLWDRTVADRMLKNNESGENKKLIRIIQQESQIDTIGFYDLHRIAKKNKVEIPKKEELIKRLKKEGYQASETHFSGTGVKSNIQKEDLVKMLKIIQ